MADTKNFTNGVKATRAELKILRSAFVDAQRPVERFSSAIQHLEGLMAKFPTRAGELRRSIHAIKAEMDSVRFARGAAWEAGFAADLDSGLARQRARGGGGGGGPGGAGAAGGAGFMRLNQATGIASKALTALNSGSILPLIGSLGSTGLAGAAVAAGVGLAALSHKAIQVADAAKQAKEEFFAKVDALKRLGADTGFADHVTRVKSLKTAWGEARSAAEQYVTTLIGRLEGGGALGGAALGASNMSATGDIAASGLRRLNAVTETHAQRMERMRFLIANGRLAGEEDRAGRVPGLRADADRDATDKQRRAFEAMADRRLAALKEIEDAEDRIKDERLKSLKEMASRFRSLFEETRTPAERLSAKLKEIQDLRARGLDPDTARRALEGLRDEALTGIPDAGGRSHAKSIAGIRAGSVEALRTQFAGGTDKSERELKAAEKTEKHTADAVTVLGRIEAAITKIEIGEAP